ncbi:FAD-binding oxidoreductase [Nonomuraea endophytica]|uniref:FAD/FMN-containing dehydrogenase n=1 Tax=Nonomuraea endophytica TaxID=714136 RepID=A0A7W8EDG8_9ACTN|nr:FAD-binding oxidoreductase [Nonomuraea endophytica]MBB5075383.1 FAD/FMN-containing dehydrogenase [Nonomuraea endophytica]
MAHTITADSDQYDSERTGFQLSASHRPDVIFAAENAADIRAAVAHAAARNLRVAVQATGHGLATAADSGVLITTGRMNGVRVDPAAATAWVEPGTPWSKVIEAAAPHGLAPLSGAAPAVGALSYTLGGGIGLMARKHGYAADQVRAIEVVTADAELVLATPDKEPDLFWALLGGRGNFGVATGMEIALVPVKTLYGGAMFFDGFDAVHAWREWVAAVPEEMTSSVAVIPFPDAPFVPEPLRGRRATHIRIAYLGPAEEGKHLTDQLRAYGPRLMDKVDEIPYTQSGVIHNDPTDPVASQSSHSLLRELPPQAVEAARSLTTNILEIRQLGGALSRPPMTPNAIGNRDAAYIYGIVSRGPEVTPEHAQLEGALRPWSTGGKALNFLFAAHATEENVKKAFDPSTYDRLRDLKTTYDPTDLFHHTHHIPPR